MRSYERLKGLKEARAVRPGRPPKYLTTTPGALRLERWRWFSVSQNLTLLARHNNISVSCNIFHIPKKITEAQSQIKNEKKQDIIVKTFNSAFFFDFWRCKISVLCSRTLCLRSEGFTHFNLWLKLWKALRVFHSLQLHALYAPFERVQRWTDGCGKWIWNQTGFVTEREQKFAAVTFDGTNSYHTLTQTHNRWLNQWRFLSVCMCGLNYTPPYAISIIQCVHCSTTNWKRCCREMCECKMDFARAKKLNEHGIFAHVNFEIDFITYRINVFIWV